MKVLEGAHLAELHWEGATAGVADGVVEEGRMHAYLPRRAGGADVPNKHHRLR